MLDVSRMAGLTATEKVVGMVLAARDGKDAFPKVATLAADTAMSETAIKRATKSLEAKGVLTKRRRGFSRSNLYIIDYEAVPLGPPQRTE